MAGSSSKLTTSYDSDDDDSDDSSGPLISVDEGLSPDVLALLLQFQSGGFDDAAEAPLQISKDAVCATFTAKDSQVIAETYKRLQQKAEDAAKAHEEALSKRIISDLSEPDTQSTASFTEALRNEGVVRVNGVLDPHLCDECLKEINEKLVAVEDKSEESSSQFGFGNVFSRNCRYDMYLRPERIYEAALASMLSRHSSLGDMFQELISKDHVGYFHELSVLIADPGAASQPIHPDSPYANQTPLWTVFVALQDTDIDMGPTTILIRTHTKESHDLLKSPEHKDGMLAVAVYKRSVLKKGDCIVMDSRTMHFGSENESTKRRALFYFTIRNPLHGIKDEDFPDCGSLFPDLSQKITTNNYYT